MVKKVERILSSKLNSEAKLKKLNELESNILIQLGILDDKHSHQLIDDNTYFKHQAFLLENQTQFSYLAEIKKAKEELTVHAPHHHTFFAFLVLIIAISAVFFNPVFTGFVTFQESQTETLPLNLSFEFNHTTELNLSNISSVAITGYFEGKNIEVYAIGENREYLLYEKKERKTNKGNLITGNVIGTEIEKNSNSSNESKIIETNDEKIIIENTVIEESNKETNITKENITKNILIPINITEEFNESIEEIIEEINNTNTSIINETINHSEEINLNISLNLTEEINESENISIELNESINFTKEINQTINLTEINITENFQDNNTEIIPENETIIPETNETSEIIEINYFNEECGRACLLRNEQIKGLKIISDGKVFIQKIDYQIPKQVEIKQIKQFENFELNLGESKTINLKEYFTKAKYYDISSSEGYYAEISKGTINITANKSGFWKSQIYATTGEDLITSNEFIIAILNNSIINETNNTINISINFSNLTIIQEKAEINKPVIWKVYGKKDKVEKLKNEKLPEITRIIQEKLEDEKTQDYLLIYETPAPLSKIKKIKENRIIQEISANESVINVTSYLDVPEGITKEGVSIYWREEEKIIENFWLEDTNKNGNNDRIYYLVPHLSNQSFEINLTILNVQSYPVVGGTWEVRFTTVGEENLTIKAIEQTSYGNSLPDDLTPVSLKCGEEGKTFDWSGNNVEAGTWSCNETAYWTVKVLTSGVHDQEFTFGNLTAQAHNDAFAAAITWETPTPSDGGTVTSNSVYLNTTITDTNETSAFFDWNNSLVGYWSFESYDATGVNDNSSQANQAIYQNSLSSSSIHTNGKFGNAIELAGDNISREYLSVADNDLDVGTKDFTADFWVYANSLPVEGYSSLLFKGNGDVNNQVGWLIRYQNTGRVLFHMGDGTNNLQYVNVYSGVGADDLPLKEWVHIAVVVDRDVGYTSYVNGNKKYDYSIDTSSNNIAGPSLNFGKDWSSTKLFFNGSLDEIKLHHRALSPEEINASINNSLWRLENNFTNLIDGTTYTYTAYAIDENGNLNTSTRTVTYNSSYVEAPTIISSRISPSEPSSSDDLIGYCNASQSSNNNVSYSWKWFKDGVFYSEGQDETSINWCAQESADVSTSCGGLSSGTNSYSGSWFSSEPTWGPTKLYDGDYSTGSFSLSGSAFYYVNYTKPSNANSSSLWEVKDVSQLNLTINQSCWDYSILQFRVESVQSTSNVFYDCYNGTDWINLRTYSSGIVFYEEKMWWAIAETASHYESTEVNVANISNSLTSNGEEWILSCRAFIGAINSEWINSSATNISSCNPSGAWNPENGISCNNTNIVVDSLTLQSGRILTLDNVNLTVNGITSISGTLHYKNSRNSFWQNGNLTVNGSLFLTNSTLRMNVSSDGEFGINITGNLFVNESSNITNGETASADYFFKIYNGATSTINNSHISKVGWTSSGENSGLWLDSPVNINNVSLNNYAGIIFNANSANSNFSNSDINGKNTGINAIIVNTNNLTISNINIYDVNAGLTSLVIENAGDNYFENLLVNNSEGIRFSSSTNNNIFNNVNLITSLNTYAVSFEDSPSNNQFNNFYINASNQSSIGIYSYLDEATMNNFFENGTVDAGSVDVRIDNLGQINFTNVTYSSGTFLDGGKLNVIWPYSVKVSNQLKQNIQDATLNISNVFSTLVISQNTDSNGEINNLKLIEYYENASGKTYFTDYTGTLYKTGFDTEIYTIAINSVENKTLTYATNVCSPDGSATWKISESVSCSNSIINSYKINITKTGNLILNNVTLISKTNSWVYGNITLNNSKNSFWNNGDLWIYGIFNLKNSSLRMNSTLDGDTGIYVNESGTFRVNETAIITNGEIISSQYQFNINGSFIADNANISQAGWTGNSTKAGIYINNAASINNSKINNFIGLILTNSANGTSIKNTEIFGTSDSKFGIKSEASFLNLDKINVSGVEGSVGFLEKTYGIFLKNSDSINLTNSIIFNNTPSNTLAEFEGIYLENSNNSKFENLSLNNNGDGGVWGFYTGIEIINSDNFEVKGINILNSPSTGTGQTYIFDISNSQRANINNINIGNINTEHYRFNNLDNSTINNLTSKNSTSTSFNFYEESSNNNISNIYIINSGVSQLSGNNQNYYNLIINNSLITYLENNAKIYNLILDNPSTTTALQVNNNFNSALYDSKILNSQEQEIRVAFNGACTNGGLKVYNTSFNISKVNTYGTCDFSSYWYTRIFVNETSGSVVNQAVINISDKDGNSVFNGLTNSSGFSSYFNTSHYFKNSSVLINYNNQTINVSKQYQGSSNFEKNISTSQTIAVTLDTNNLPTFGTEILKPGGGYLDGYILYLDNVDPFPDTYTPLNSEVSAAVGTGLSIYPLARAMFDFYIQNISNEASISKVELGLTLSRDGNLDVHIASRSGIFGAHTDESVYLDAGDSTYGSTINTWNNAGVNSSQYQDLGSSAITYFENNALSNGYFGVGIRSVSEATIKKLNKFHTIESTTPAYHPKLRVSYAINNYTLETNKEITLFDLDEFFSDPDGDNTLTYSFSGNSSIQISLDIDNNITFSTSTDFTGSETINITATDTYGAYATSNDFIITAYSRPGISNLKSSPEPQGYGLFKKINATINDAEGVSSAKVEITPPSGSPTNYSMTNVGGNIWEYNYTNWANGTYNYKIWANSTNNYWNSSIESSFTYSTNASVLVETISSNYDQNEIVNITDTSYSNNNQSLINNTGSSNFSAYVYMATKFWNATTGIWVLDDEVINNYGPYQINSSSNFSLSQLWNNNYNTSNASFGAGTYQVYIELRDDSNNLLRSSNGIYLNNSYNFAYSNNTVPMAVSASLSPNTVYTNETIILNAICSDYNLEDSLVAVYEIYKNGINQTSLFGNSSATNGVETNIASISYENTKNGQEWSARIKCFDGTAYSSWQWVSSNITVQNYTTTIILSNETDTPGTNIDTEFYANYSGPDFGFGPEIGNLIWNTSTQNQQIASLRFFDYDNDYKKNDLVIGTAGCSAGDETIAYKDDGSFLWSDGGCYTWNLEVADVFQTGYQDGILEGLYSSNIRYKDKSGNNNYSTSEGINNYDIDYFDVNNDGEIEVFGIDNQGSGILFMYNRTAGQVWNYTIGGTINSGEIFAFKNNNNYYVAAHRRYGTALVFNASSGKNIFNSSSNNGANTQGSFNAMDLDYDNETEVLLIGLSNEVEFFNLTGSQLSISPLSVSGAVIELEVADLDNDGKEDELIISTANNELYVYEINSTDKTLLWQFSNSLRLYNILAIDIDDDGFKEVIASESDTDADSLYVFDAAGNIEFLYKTPELGTNSGLWGSRPALDTADVNNDGILDIGLGGIGNKAYIVQEVSCIANFDDSTTYNMTWNFSSRLWQTNKTFTSTGSHYMNVTCSKGAYTTQFKENYFTVYNNPPTNPSVNINSSSGLNGSGENLNCFATISDPNLDLLNVSVKWYLNGNLNQTFDYNNSYASGTNFVSVLGSGNTSKGQNWSCSMRLFDGSAYSSWSNSSNLSIINAAPILISSRISPETSAASSENLAGYCNATDLDEENVFYYWRWYKDNSLFSSNNEEAGSTWCYQETANVATGCGGLSTGSYSSSGAWYNFANTYDGSWSSNGFELNEESAYLYINYSKPSGADQSTSQWQVKPGTSSSNTINYTIPSNCWSQEPIQLRVGSFSYLGTHNMHCWSGSTWTQIQAIAGGGSIYEEAMWWNIISSGHNSGEEYNVETIDYSNTNIGEEWILSCMAFDGSENSSWLNSSITTISNGIPTTPVPVINSSDGTNRSNQNLNCVAMISDSDNHALNVSVRWYLNGTINLTYDYNNSYASGTNFTTTLGSGNTSKNDKWSCGIRTYDGYNYSSWGLSSNLTVIGEYELSACTNIIGPGEYTLLNDISNSGVSYCFNISANNVGFNCQNNLIDGDTNSDYAIYAYRSSSEVSNVSINNCRFSDWDTSTIFFRNGSGNTISNINISDSYDDSIYLLDSDNNSLSKINGINPGTSFIRIENSENNNISNFNFSGSITYGLYILSSNSNLFNNGILNNTGTNKISIENSYGNIFTDILANENGQYYLDITATNPSFCDNKFINYSNSYGKEIKYYNYSINLENINNISDLILCDADYSEINNLTINNEGHDKGNNKILVINTDYLNITNSKTTNTFAGIQIEDSSNLIINNFNATNFVNGISIQGTNESRNILINNSFFSNTTSISGNGIYSGGYDMFDITINNITIQKCLNDALRFYSTSNSYGNKITNSLIINNGFNTGSNGIFARGSKLNITNNIIKNNVGNGLELQNLANSVIKNNIIQNNSGRGIYYDDLGIGVGGESQFYNNLLNNTVNIAGTDPHTNEFNTSLQYGSRIHSNGALLGGNFWANISNGQGFSETCTDNDKDGFCDSSYSINTGMVDYLPYSKEYVNVDPSISYINLSPETPYTNQDIYLNGTCIISNHTNHLITAYYEIYKENINQTSLAGNTIVNNNSNNLFQTISNTLTTKNETWSARIKCYDGDSYSAWVWSNPNSTIENSIPSIPNPDLLLQNASTHIRKPFFNWSVSTDIDSIDTITYEINLTNPSGACYTTYTIGISDNNWTPNFPLCVNDNGQRVYNWRIRASDGQDFSAWTTIRNFTVESLLDILLIDNSSNLGNINRDGTSNTTSTNDSLEIRNDGNVYVNLSIAAETGLWTSVPLNTSYFQYQAINNESNSFNTTLTNSGWINLSNSNKILAVDFNYDNSSDQAFIHFQATGPHEEPPGTKQATLNITAEYTHD